MNLLCICCAFSMFNRLQLGITVVHKQIYAFIGVIVNFSPHGYIFSLVHLCCFDTRGRSSPSVWGKQARHNSRKAINHLFLITCFEMSLFLLPLFILGSVSVLSVIAYKEKQHFLMLWLTVAALIFICLCPFDNISSESRSWSIWWNIRVIIDLFPLWRGIIVSPQVFPRINCAL